jgi:hypothetical protein
MRIDLYAAATGSEIYGVSTGIVQRVFGNWTDTLNMTFRFCRFTDMLYLNSFNFTSFIVENCLFDGGSLQLNWNSPYIRKGLVIRNNIFGTFGFSTSASIYQPRDNTIIDHNIFIGTVAAVRAIAAA